MAREAKQSALEHWENADCDVLMPIDLPPHMRQVHTHFMFFLDREWVYGEQSSICYIRS